MNQERISTEERERGMSARTPSDNSIQRRADFLIETLKESSDAELRQFFIDLSDWVLSDEKILKLYFAEMDERR